MTHRSVFFPSNVLTKRMLQFIDFVVELVNLRMQIGSNLDQQIPQLITGLTWMQLLLLFNFNQRLAIAHFICDF